MGKVSGITMTSPHSHLGGHNGRDQIPHLIDNYDV